MIKVFECPFRNRCARNESMTVDFFDETISIPVVTECKAPFLITKKDGQRLCMIAIEDDKIDNFADMYRDIKIYKPTLWDRVKKLWRLSS